MKLQPVILAGGNGYRLWPLSQKTMPKQFIKHFGRFSTFQMTIMRNNHLGTPLIIANIHHKEIINEQLKEIDSHAKIIFEPVSRNTAACALAASYYAKRKGFDSIALIPCDHQIDLQEEYNHALEMADLAIRKYKFCTIGIKQGYPNPNFGYIKTCKQISKDLCIASKFIEKPDKALTKDFFKDASYFWNSGIYFFQIDYVLSLALKFVPEIAQVLKLVFSYDAYCQDIVFLDFEVYNKLPFLSFDNAISEKLDTMALVVAHFKWNELGNWETIWNLNKKDENQNNINGQVLTHKVSNSYIDSDAEKTIAIDLQDIVVIFKNGQLLVANKNSTDLIKHIITEMP